MAGGGLRDIREAQPPSAGGAAAHPSSAGAAASRWLGTAAGLQATIELLAVLLVLPTLGMLLPAPGTATPTSPP